MTASFPFRRIGIVGQTRDPQLESAAATLEGLAEGYGLELMPETDLAPLFPASRPFAPGECDMLLCFGGDGTLLRGARLVAAHHTPVLGVNLGYLGFLTSVGPAHLTRAFQALAEHAFWLDNRVTLEARVVTCAGTVGTEYLALNDAVLHKGGFARVVRLAVYLGEEREEVAAFAADGIIIATPTGSTAYSLSAGGAVVGPTVECLLATPISPHTLAIRPLVLPAGTRIEVEILQPGSEVVLTIDGQVGEQLLAGDRLVVQQGKAVVPLVRFPGQSFFSTLRRKLHWGVGAPAGQGSPRVPVEPDPFAY
jgi:NAD+ kinase